MARRYRVISVPVVRFGLGAVVLSDATHQAIGDKIQQVEGWFPGSVSYRNNNPGNLKYVGQSGAIGKDSLGFAVFPSYQTGVDALYHQLDLYAGRGLTIGQMMNIYAPASDNNDPASYAQAIAGNLGVNVATKLSDLDSSGSAPPFSSPAVDNSVASFDPLAELAGVDPLVVGIVAGLAVLALVTVL